MAVVNVTHNIQPDIKASVEKNCEIPQKMKIRDNITEAESGKTMATGLTQAKEVDSLTVEEAFSNLRMESMKRVAQWKLKNRKLENRGFPLK